MLRMVFILVFAMVLISCSENKAVSEVILINDYTKEISSLKSEEEIDKYWVKLFDLDQTTYMKETQSQKKGDSLSIANMIRTAKMFEIHGKKCYKLNNTVPILNLAHNQLNGESSLAFWPVIQQCKSLGGVINNFGGAFPAYQLEAISLEFYDYSLFDQDSIYPKLLHLLNEKKYNKVSSELIDVYKQQKQLEKLTQVEVLGTWKRQHFKNSEDDSLGSFEFVKMSDNNLYIKKENRLQLLEKLSSNDQFQTYRVKKEPFNWHYNLKSNSILSLEDDKGNTLMIYKKA